MYHWGDSPGIGRLHRCAGHFHVGHVTGRVIWPTSMGSIVKCLTMRSVSSSILGKEFVFLLRVCYMGVSKNNGTPKSSILIGVSIINHPFWGTPIFGNIYMSPLNITKTGGLSSFSAPKIDVNALPRGTFIANPAPCEVLLFIFQAFRIQEYRKHHNV